MFVEFEIGTDIMGAAQEDIDGIAVTMGIIVVVVVVVKDTGADDNSSGGFRFSVILLPLPVYITEYI